MSIDQINKIDVISTTPDGKVMLTISDHHLWDDVGEHLLLLQDKLNSYLQFIEGGQIFEEYPQAKSNEILIEIDMKYMPNEVSEKILNLFKETVVNAGIGFNWNTVKSE